MIRISWNAYEFIWYTEYVRRSCGQSRTRWVVARLHLRTATGLPLCTRVTTARVETLTDVSCTNRWSRTWIVRRQLVCTFSPSGACMFGLWGGRDLLWRVSWSLWWVRHFGNGVVGCHHWTVKLAACPRPTPTSQQFRRKEMTTNLIPNLFFHPQQKSQTKLKNLNLRLKLTRKITRTWKMWKIPYKTKHLRQKRRNLN